MRRLICVLLLLCVAGFAAGCVTVDRYFSGPFEARILDAATRSSIAGAKVTLTSQEPSGVSAQALSDSAGRVSIPPLFGKARVFLFGDTLSKPVSLRVEASGYAPFIVDVLNVGSRANVERYYRNPNDTRPPAEILLSRQSP